MGTRPWMATLKQATAGHHDRVERRVDLPSRCADPTAYGELLAALEAFYRALEPRLLADPGLRAALPDAPERAKLPWLRADLHALGLRPSGAAPAASRVDAAGADRALGCLYVLEGATLGGAGIARAVEAALGLGPASGTAFFTSYGRERGARWRAFGDAVEAHAAGRGLAGATIAAAQDTFAAFEAHLTDHPRTRALAA